LKPVEAQCKTLSEKQTKNEKTGGVADVVVLSYNKYQKTNRKKY
jgi:hypothetical protein